MMIFWKAGLVILSMPKTGTHALQAALADKADIVFRHPQALKHMPARRLRREILPLLDSGRVKNLSMLAVIREPVDWLGSWYRYRSRPQLDGDPKSTAGISFDTFVAGYLAPEQPPFAKLGSQARFVSNRQDKVIVKHLFAYEQPAALQEFLAHRLGFKMATTPRLNVSPAGDLALSEAHESALKNRLSSDFALHDALLRGTPL